MTEPRIPSRAERKALLGIKECARRGDGWATMWPYTVKVKYLASCVEAGWLEQGTKGEGGLPYVAYRLTEAGEAALDARKEAPECTPSPKTE